MVLEGCRSTSSAFVKQLDLVQGIQHGDIFSSAPVQVRARCIIIENFFSLEYLNPIITQYTSNITDFAIYCMGYVLTRDGFYSGFFTYITSTAEDMIRRIKELANIARIVFSLCR